MQLLTINTGSSSLKAALYRTGDADAEETRLLGALAERISQPDGHLRIEDAHDAALVDRQQEFPDHAAALGALLDFLKGSEWAQELDSVGHRVVYGGAAYREPMVLTPSVVDALRALIPRDPAHMPQALAAIDAVVRAYPSVPQVACFDTAFHRTMPQVAQMYPLPRWLWDEGVRRYGFHGLSYEYILGELRRIDPVAATGRVIVAHLGNGVSMAAVRDGASVETTMGFTPTGGLVMGTRSGDLDPGVPLYLLQTKGMTPDALSRLMNREAGLLGVSATSSDMRELLAREASDPRAAEAVALFCYTAKKYLGALAAVLGGLDMLVFTGGIGEHAAPVRTRICDGLEFLGIQIDPARNDAHAPIISAERQRDQEEARAVVVRVMRTDEDLMIARHTYRLLARASRTGGHDVSV